MSFIQFESGREKEKARQDLREAREHMLEEAKKRAEQRADRNAKSLLKGEINWMLPSVKDKLLKKSKEHKKQKNKKKQSKKSKQKSHKKHRYSTSEDESDSGDDDSTSDGTDSSESDKHKSSSKSKKKKSHKKRRHASSEDEMETTDNGSTTSGSNSPERNKDKRTKKSRKSKKDDKSKETRSKGSANRETDDKLQNIAVKNSEQPIKRDSWMTDAVMLKTFSRERVENKPNANQQIDIYDPAKSSRELNPYWKSTGTGLPSFQRPKDEEDNISVKSVFSQRTIGTKGWKKQAEKLQSQDHKESQIPGKDTNSSSDRESEEEEVGKCNTSASEFLTDQQMNELGAKILKAEIMGNMGLADELREKLEKARTQRNIFKERKKAEFIKGKQHNSYRLKNGKPNQDQHILLTHTDQLGNTRPLPASKGVDPKDLYGGKKKQKRVNTHDDSGKRIRYYADDDRYDIKQMFEREKYTSASDSNLAFASIAGKHKNPNDDLEDIFAEKICRDDSVPSSSKDHHKAIREHQKIEATLDNCDKCFDSTKMQKELLVCVGEKVYLALPWYQGLQPGHCMIVPTQHATCSTQIDEDTWTEVNDFRKSLTRMFASQRKDVIFFEIANKLHRRPHLAIHCVPIQETDGEMAPFYFKKAIEESEYEWCVNKQLVSLRNKSLRNAIPKGLPYFWVNFGMDSGFAHVIEDEERFPSNYAQEIIGGMLNLEASKWRRQQKEQNIITKVKMFAEWWKKYDCTK